MWLSQNSHDLSGKSDLPFPNVTSIHPSTKLEVPHFHLSVCWPKKCFSAATRTSCKVHPPTPPGGPGWVVQFHGHRPVDVHVPKQSWPGFFHSSPALRGDANIQGHSHIYRTNFQQTNKQTLSNAPCIIPSSRIWSGTSQYRHLTNKNWSL